jgi:hypothetical protein
VLSLTAKGLTTGEVAAHFADIYGASVSKDTISKITDKVIAEMTDWCNPSRDRRGGLGHGAAAALDRAGDLRVAGSAWELRRLKPRDRRHRGIP